MSQLADRREPMLTPAAAAATVSNQLVIGAVAFLLMVVAFIAFLYVYAKYYMGSSNPALRRARARLIFASADQIPAPRRGLDAEVLKSLPVTIFTPSAFKDGIECAVCLSELSEGEGARILPKCSHGFHVECIDMWFHSHVTCPLCRAPVTAAAEPPQVQAPESVSFPTNVLFWGSQDTQGGTSSASGLRRPEGMLVIDIPTRAVEDIVSPSPASKVPAEERTPRSARMRSLRRLLSRGKMVVGSSCSPRGGDIEQGSSVAPIAPAS